MKYLHTLLFVFASAFITSCNKTPQLPTDVQLTDEVASVYPDYKDITIPPNIAPLNVKILNEAEDYLLQIKGKEQSLLYSAIDSKITFDAEEWKKLLDENKGGKLDVKIFSLKQGVWYEHPAYSIYVASESIDPYLVYRLIEPSYELYRQLGIYQRNLESFDEDPIYENNRTFDNQNNHCINCHHFQNYSTEKMLFHVRAKHGGTIVVENGVAKKYNMKTDSVLSNTVYPAWHPSQNIVAFSSNKTGQAFHMLHPQKVEVIDYASDLVLFDAQNATLQNVLKTDDTMETFPAWNPQGDRLYFCSSSVPSLAGLPDSTASNHVLARYDSIRYNLMSMPFDTQTRTFGEPTIELNCDSMKKSATLPRISPDGKYLLFTLGDYGQFHIWHQSADLYVKNLHTQSVYPLTNANSNDVESYHAWSSNGRWIVFATRRENTSYSRAYIAYFSPNGEAHKAFLLPQADPDHNTLRLKSYNVPELIKHKVEITKEELKEVIYNDDNVTKINYQSK